MAGVPMKEEKLLISTFKTSVIQCTDMQVIVEKYIFNLAVVCCILFVKKANTLSNNQWQPTEQSYQHLQRFQLHLSFELF